MKLSYAIIFCCFINFSFSLLGNEKNSPMSESLALGDTENLKIGDAKVISRLQENKIKEFDENKKKQDDKKKEENLKKEHNKIKKIDPNLVQVEKKERVEGEGPNHPKNVDVIKNSTIVNINLASSTNNYSIITIFITLVFTTLL